MFLALDPSSKVIGAALFELGACVSASLIKPRRQKDQALDRIDYMVTALSAIIDAQVVATAQKRRTYKRLTVIVEVTSGKVNPSRHGGGGAGLAIYGDAVGSVRTMCRLHPSVDAVIRVFENDWIGGFGKAKRRRVAKAAYPQYNPKTDPGSDLADAIALGVWWKEIGRKRDG